MLGMDTAVVDTTITTIREDHALIVRATGPAAMARAAGEAYELTGYAHGHSRTLPDGTAEVAVLYSDMRLARGGNPPASVQSTQLPRFTAAS